MDIQKALSELVGSDAVSADPEVLKGYGEDFSLVSRRSPECVVKPTTLEQVQSLVQWANRESMPVVAVSSSSPGMRGAAVPRMGGVVLDLTDMRRILRLDRRNRVVLVEPGVTFEQLLPELKAEGLRLPLSLCPPADKSVVAWALEREPGLMPRYHWDMTDPLLCMEVVFGNGEAFRTGEAAGPGSLEEQWRRGGAQKFPLGPHQVDYHRFIQGSLGTIGVVTWASIKCEILPSVRKTFLAGASSPDAFADFVYRLIRLELVDECFLLNRTNLACLLGMNREDVQDVPRGLPAWVLVFCIAGLEYLPEERVAYRTADARDLAARCRIQVKEKLGPVHADRIGETIGNPCGSPYWKLRWRGGCEEVFFLTTLDRVQQFVDRFEALRAQAEFPASDVGAYVQPVVQGTSCHVAFDLYYDRQQPEARVRVAALKQDAVDMISRLGGFFSRPYPQESAQVFSRYAEHTAFARKLKSVFDPNGILNPGKLCY